MKITFLLTQDLGSPSGLGRFAPLARELARHGHKVTIYALHPDMQSLAQKRWSEGHLTVEYVAAMHVRKQGSQKTYYSLPRLLWVVVRAGLALTRAALRDRPDLIWVGKPHPMNGLAGLAARLRWGCPLFLDCDDDEAGSGRFRYGWQRGVVGWFERWLPRFAARVTVNTLYTYENMFRRGVPPDRLTYLPNGADLERFSTPPGPAEVNRLRQQLGLEGSSVISYIGSLSTASHAVDLLLRAFARLTGQRPDARLLLVGGGEDYDTLRAQAAQLGLAGRVVFTGRVDPAQVMVYYRLSDVTVDPVYNNTAAMGRSPLKLFEAWVCETPFVTSPVGDRAALAGDLPAALLVEAGDEQALSEGLLRLIDDPDLRLDLARRGLARLQDFTWARLVERVPGLVQPPGEETQTGREEPHGR